MAEVSLEILYEDNHLIAVNKSPGEIVQGDKTGDEPLCEKVKSWIKEKYSKPGAVFLGVIHRLDRPVSGIVIFAKTSKGLARMNEQFRNREVSKTYWAVVSPPPEKTESVLIHYLIKNESTNKSKAHIKEVNGSSKSELHYKVMGTSDRYTLLEVNPVTGRHHQIRAQLAAIGCSIKGDLKYGSPRSNRDASIHLHARKLTFNHPVSGEPVVITATPPSDPVWNYFSSLLTA
ncbi:MAG TPA: RNA pseudouridine synthase [Bacteroidia bacterium]|nr:RNA pseudouridine synthase [Bacteroidia bacterium]